MQNRFRFTKKSIWPERFMITQLPIFAVEIFRIFLIFLQIRSMGKTWFASLYWPAGSCWAPRRASWCWWPWSTSWLQHKTVYIMWIRILNYLFHTLTKEMRYRTHWIMDMCGAGSTYVWFLFKCNKWKNRISYFVYIFSIYRLWICFFNI